MKKTALLLAACAGSVLACASANATIVTRNYDLVASDFEQAFGPGTAAAPVDPMHLNFTLTFDDSVDTLDGVTEGLVVNSFNLPYTLKYTYFASFDFLIIGTAPIPYGACVQFSIIEDNFCAFIDNAAQTSSSATPATVTFDDWSGTYILSLATPTHQWNAREAQLVVTAPGAVPEPASWALMIAGFGLAGAAMRRRQAIVSFA